MTNKNLNLLVFITYIYCGSVKAQNQDSSVWANSPVGNCSQDSANSKQTQSEMDSSGNDDLIVKTEPHRGKNGEQYVWNWNSAPSRNATRTLVMTNKKGLSCIILYLPDADSYNFKLSRNGNLPQFVTSQTSPLNLKNSFATTKITYTLDQKTGFYSKFPTQCIKVINNKITKKISCLDAISE
jgi:hypothetical protein